MARGYLRVPWWIAFENSGGVEMSLRARVRVVLTGLGCVGVAGGIVAWLANADRPVRGHHDIRTASARSRKVTTGEQGSRISGAPVKVVAAQAAAQAAAR